MNATLPIPTASSPGATGSAVSPVDFVRAMAPEDKQAVFLTLLREALEINGDWGRMHIEDEEGQPMGYYMPQRAVMNPQELLPDPTPEQAAKLDRLLAEPGIPAAEVLADLKARLAALQKPTP